MSEVLGPCCDDPGGVTVTARISVIPLFLAATCLAGCPHAVLIAPANEMTLTFPSNARVVERSHIEGVGYVVRRGKGEATVAVKVDMDDGRFHGGENCQVKEMNGIPVRMYDDWDGAVRTRVIEILAFPNQGESYVVSVQDTTADSESSALRDEIVRTLAPLPGYRKVIPTCAFEP